MIVVGTGNLVWGSYSGPMSTTCESSRSNRDDPANLVDWRGVGDMVAIATEQVSAPVEGMHRAIIGRWFGMAGSHLDGERHVVDGLIASMYSTVRLGGSAIGSAISTMSDLASDHVNLPPVWETAKGAYVQSIFNGVWGDQLEDNRSPLRIDIGVRDPSGRPIPPTQGPLGQAFPDATGRLAVMVHGLGETEQYWRSIDGSTLADGLEQDGFTVLGLRYNTGRTVIDNGSEVATLVEAIRVAWPVPVSEIVLVGHSMGGLVARSAVVAAGASGLGWADLATHLVGVGTPHLGTPIEKAVHGVSLSLGLLNETRPIASFLESRSAGIKDLRNGINEKPVGVQCHVIAGSVTTEPTHPVGALLGDLVVSVGSAIDRGRRHHDPSSNVLVLGGRNHGNLIHDPQVISHTRRWLTPSR